MTIEKTIFIIWFSFLFIKDEKNFFTGGSGYIGSHIINELNKHSLKFIITI